MANRHMKRCSTLLTSRDTKNATQNHNEILPHPVKVSTIKKKDERNAGVDVQRRDLLYIAGGNVNCMENRMEDPQEVIVNN